MGLPLSHAISWNDLYAWEHLDELQRVDVDPDGPMVLSQKLYGSEEEEVIEGVVCQNPFFGDKEQTNSAFEIPDNQLVLAGVEYLKGRLKNTVDEDFDYDLFVNHMMVDHLSYVTKAPLGIVNIDLEVNW